MSESLTQISDHCYAKIAHDLIPSQQVIADRIGVHVNTFGRVYRIPEASFSRANSLNLARLVEAELGLPTFSRRIEDDDLALTVDFEKADVNRGQQKDRIDLTRRFEHDWFYLKAMDPDESDDPVGARYLRARYTSIAAWTKVPLPGLSLAEGLLFGLADIDKAEKAVRRSRDKEIRRVLGRVLRQKAAILQLLALHRTGIVPALGAMLSADDMRALYRYHDEAARAYARSMHDPRLQSAALNVIASGSAYAAKVDNARKNAEARKVCASAFKALVARWPEFRDLDHKGWSLVDPAQDPDLAYFRTRIAPSINPKRGVLQ
ncbi:hypothetical protein SAZ10_02545 [Mesorhizobium sp. BAC0120]|uniref:hypothetical protein n=1 Tax=Mesorhizobium sp. BAC0120 TaxID=3090670 RepID=UPI00298C038C|nr:hypothetical protein [Mesorhizobium sp. BAC0120]MDW6020636.1 hypothetical protein [Mesorhizobium sp. BAC0120]